LNTMKLKLIILIIALGILSTSHGQQEFFATVQLKYPVPDACNPDTIYLMLTFMGQKGQVEAVPPQTIEQIVKQVKATSFYKTDVKLKATIKIDFVISCEGNVASCRFGEGRKQKFKNEAYNKEMLDIF